ncbi:hypothetical protein [Gallintestinimicrobium sp.]|uniref:hypothetical protein n=1 Tax=Gallintestinimicrobium sp. TaxID=2981655 RepID=UPI003AEFD1B5
MFDFQDKKNRYKMTAAALFTAAAMCVGGCGDAAAATSGAAGGSTTSTADTGAQTAGASGNASKTDTAGSASAATNASTNAADGSTTADAGASTSDTASAAAAVWHESGMETDKEESVYVLTDAYGTPTEITVTTGLKNPGPDAELTDVTTLTDIVNKEGDETYTKQADGSILWENYGSDIHYEGKADTSSELPLTVKVTYFLDGKEVGADELAGADGNIKIRFDYENNTQENGSITPFAAITGLMLSEDNAHNISVTNGASRYMDGEYLVYGFALPGVTAALDLDTMELTKEEEIDLHDFMEVSFEAEDFELDFTATMVSNGLLEEKDYDKVIDKLDELTDKLEDTTDQVKDLKSKISKLKNGGEKLRSGADSLYQGLSEVNAALAQAAQADPSLAGLAASISQLTDGSKQLADSVSTYTKGVEKACDSIDDSSSSNTDDTEKKQELQSLTEKLKSLKENDGAYNNFSGLEDGKTGSVSFIIETDEIKK